MRSAEVLQYTATNLNILMKEAKKYLVGFNLNENLNMYMVKLSNRK